MRKNQAFYNAPIGAKVSVSIAPGIRHQGRKFDHNRIIEFSKKRGWAIVDFQTFSNGKLIHVSLQGHLPSQIEMLNNQQKYAKKNYSLTGFNCDAGQNVLAGHPPKSHQVDSAMIGATTFGVIAKAKGAGAIATLAVMVIGGLLGSGIANMIEDSTQRSLSN